MPICVSKIVLGMMNVIAPTIAPTTTKNTSLLKEKSILICSIFFFFLIYFLQLLVIYLPLLLFYHYPNVACGGIPAGIPVIIIKRAMTRPATNPPIAPKAVLLLTEGAE